MSVFTNVSGEEAGSKMKEPRVISGVLRQCKGQQISFLSELDFNLFIFQLNRVMRFIIPAHNLADRKVPQSTVHLCSVKHQFPCNAEDLHVHIADQRVLKADSLTMNNC